LEKLDNDKVEPPVTLSKIEIVVSLSTSYKTTSPKQSINQFEMQ